MYNYRIIIQYDGTRYNGWQSQPDGNTVQDKITGAISQISGEEVKVVGSGRTDAGVHALGQVANFRIPVELDLFKFQHSLNAVLPDDISIVKLEKAHWNFHARYYAKKRTYFYLFTKFKSPFYSRYSWYNTTFSGLDVNKLNEISQPLLGEHDFTSFTRKKIETPDRICNVFQIRWSANKNFIIFRITANRFLRGMVRTIVGTLLDSAFDENSVEKIKEILELKNRDSAGQTAPPQGLFLYKIEY